MPQKKASDELKKIEEDSLSLVVKNVAKDIVRETYHYPRLLLLGYKSNNKVIVLGSEINTSTMIGNSEGIGFAISDPTISKSHCEIVKLNEHVYAISDLRTLNGTYVNGKRLKSEQVILSNGDIVKIGGTELLYIDEEDPNFKPRCKVVIDIEEFNESGPNIENLSPFYRSVNSDRTVLTVDYLIGSFTFLTVAILVILTYGLVAI